MIDVKSVKPKLGGVLDNKPKLLVRDVKPKLSVIGVEQMTYIDNIMAYKGQPMGLLLALTYPVDMAMGTTARL